MKKALYFILLMVVLAMVAGCDPIREDDFVSLETGESVVIEGHVFTSSGRPVKDAVVAVIYEETYYSSSVGGRDIIRNKAKVKTDADGRYRLFFEIRDDELVENENSFKHYWVRYHLDKTDVDNLYMQRDGLSDIDESDAGNIIKSQLTPTSLKKGETYNESLYIPQKRNIKVTLTAPFPEEKSFFSVSNKFPYGFGYYEDINGIQGPFDMLYYPKVVKCELKDRTKETFYVACALNEYNTFIVTSRQNGKAVENEHVIYVTEDSPESLSFDFTENLNAEKTEPPVGKPDLIVDWPEETRVGAEGGDFYIPVITEEEYSYSIIGGHFDILHDECTESMMAIRIYANYDYEERTAQLMFKSGDFRQYVTFIQEPCDHIYIPGWVPHLDELLFNDSACYEELVVISNVDYEYGVIAGNDWLSIARTSKDGNRSVFSVAVAENKGNGRTGQVRFWYGNIDLVVNVVQEPVKGNIEFEDPVVKSICVANWDTDKDGELSYKEAYAVESLMTEFKGNTEITRFNEFKYFSGLREMALSGWAGTFEGCSSLRSIEIPESVISLGFRTFAGCSGLTDVKLGGNIIHLGSSTFYDCESLKEIVLPENIAELDDNVFNGCIGLESLEIPESVSKIGSYAFYGCGLKEMRIPANVKEIRQEAFRSSRIEIIVLPEGLESLERAVFAYCGELRDVDIPDTVKSIGEYCFESCKNLKSVILPPTLTKIAGKAFNNTDITEGVICHAATPPAIESDTFGEVGAVYVPDKSLDVYKTSEHWSGFSNVIYPMSSLGK